MIAMPDAGEFLLAGVVDSSPGTVASNFSGTGVARTSINGDLVHIDLDLVSTNTITASSGNITDTTCYTLKSAYRPSEALQCIFGSGVTGGLATINTDGTVVLRAAWATISASDSVNLSACYLRG